MRLMTTAAAAATVTTNRVAVALAWTAIAVLALPTQMTITKVCGSKKFKTFSPTKRTETKQLPLRQQKLVEESQQQR